MSNDREVKVTPQTALVLDILLKGERLSGAEIARATRLKSGTLYPLLLRLERAGWLTSEWEREEPAVLGRPRRRFYAVTAVGIANARDAGTQNAKIFGRLAWS